MVLWLGATRGPGSLHAVKTLFSRHNVGSRGKVPQKGILPTEHIKDVAFWASPWGGTAGRGLLAGALSMTEACAKLLQAPAQVALLLIRRASGDRRAPSALAQEPHLLPSVQSLPPKQTLCPNGLLELSLCASRMLLLGPWNELKFRLFEMMHSEVLKSKPPATWASWVFRTKRLSDCLPAPRSQHRRAIRGQRLWC